MITGNLDHSSFTKQERLHSSTLPRICLLVLALSRSLPLHLEAPGDGYPMWRLQNLLQSFTKRMISDPWGCKLPVPLEHFEMHKHFSI